MWEYIFQADGGYGVETEPITPSTDRPDDCACTPRFEQLPCWPCYRAGFEEPNSDIGGNDE